MTTTQLRRRAKRRIDALPESRLRVVDDFLAYLEERELNDATRELLSVPGLLDEVAGAEREASRGKLVPVERLRRRN